MNLKEFIYKIIGMPTMEDDTSRLISPPVLVEFNGELLNVKDVWYRGDDTVIISADIGEALQDIRKGIDNEQ